MKIEQNKKQEWVEWIAWFLILIVFGLWITLRVKTYTAIFQNNTMLRQLLEQQTVNTETVVTHEEPEDQAKVEVSFEESEECAAEQTEVFEDETVVLYYEPELIEAKDGKILSKNVDLPDLPTDRKVCTDYRVYNIPGTPHNRMQLLAWTDDLGCRRYNDYYIVGLGSAYADKLGEVFEAELETGVIFRIITGDMKADRDTDISNRFGECYNYDGEYCANILEFIIDKEVLAKEAYLWGGVDYYEKFKGNIIRMTYLGRDTSADWDSYM